MTHRTTLAAAGWAVPRTSLRGRQAPSFTAPPPADTRRPPQGTSLRVLVVDDDPEIRDMLSFSLALEGFDVTTASNGADALEALRAKGADVVLLDIMMPVLSGYDVVDRLRGADGPEIPVVFLTARAGDRDVWEGWARGGHSYITKPVDLDLLVSEIARVGSAGCAA